MPWFRRNLLSVFSTKQNMRSSEWLISYTETDHSGSKVVKIKSVMFVVFRLLTGPLGICEE